MNYNIEIMKEEGYHEALMGLSLSYNRPVSEMGLVARKIYKNGSHGKFLESICVWLDITMPRYFWSEFDTYRVGMTKQSESTMHTIFKNELTQNDFVRPINEYNLRLLNELINLYIEDKNRNTSQRSMDQTFNLIKTGLPEGFLQRRIVCTNYKTLRNIIQQRKNHRLEEWKAFCKSIKENCKYKEFLE